MPLHGVCVQAYNARKANVTVLVLMRDEEHAALPPPTSRVVDPTDSTKFVDIAILGATYELGMELMEIYELTDGVSILYKIHTLTTYYIIVIIHSTTCTAYTHR